MPSVARYHHGNYEQSYLTFVISTVTVILGHRTYMMLLCKQKDLSLTKQKHVAVHLCIYACESVRALRT